MLRFALQSLRRRHDSAGRIADVVVTVAVVEVEHTLFYMLGKLLALGGGELMVGGIDPVGKAGLFNAALHAVGPSEGIVLCIGGVGHTEDDAALVERYICVAEGVVGNEPYAEHPDEHDDADDYARSDERFVAVYEAYNERYYRRKLHDHGENEHRLYKARAEAQRLRHLISFKLFVIHFSVSRITLSRRKAPMCCRRLS